MLSYFGIVPEGSLLDVPNAALGAYLKIFAIFVYRPILEILTSFPLICLGKSLLMGSFSDTRTRLLLLLASVGKVVAE